MENEAKVEDRCPNPECRARLVYIGFLSISCANPECRNWDPKHVLSFEDKVHAIATKYKVKYRREDNGYFAFDIPNTQDYADAYYAIRDFITDPDMVIEAALEAKGWLIKQGRTAIGSTVLAPIPADPFLALAGGTPVVSGPPVPTPPAAAPVVGPPVPASVIHYSCGSTAAIGDCVRRILSTQTFTVTKIDVLFSSVEYVTGPFHVWCNTRLLVLVHRAPVALGATP